MKKHPLILLPALLFFFPAHAFALAQEYYTWGGHDAVVSAFNKSALIFSDASYSSLAATLATASLAALLVRVMYNLMAGGFKGDGGAVVFQGVAPWLITVAIFLGTVIPKGTLHIYDKTENKYQAIGSIPLIVVVMASVTNKIERVMVEAVETAGDPLNFTAQAGGKGYMGLESLSTTGLVATDTLLSASLQNYLADCVLFEVARTPGLVDEIKKGSTNLQTTFAKGVSPANVTTLFSSGGSLEGQVVSCTQAWTDISTRLNLSTLLLTNNLVKTCSGMGFDSADAAQRNDCMQKMSAVVDAQLVPGSTAADYLKNQYLSQQFDAMLNSPTAGESVANFQILNKASGVMSTANNWIPAIRAVILSVTVALTPFICLLMLTPFFGRAIKFLLGSFMILTVWSVTDATLHQFAIDNANKLLADVRQYNYGIDALRLMPETTGKILAMFGMLRASSLALALAITSSVIGLGASVAAAVGGKLAADVTQTGAQGEQQVLDPGQKASLRRANQGAVPTEAMANQYSFSQRTGTDFGRESGQLENMQGSLDATGGATGWQQLQHGQGFTNAYRGQGDVGLNQAFMQQAQSMGIPQEQAQKIAAATVNHGEGLAELRRLQQQGFTGQQAADAYWQGKTVDHKQSKSVGQEQGFTMYRPTEGQETGKWGQVQATWQNGSMVGMQGNSVNVASTEQLRSSYDKSFGHLISESGQKYQSVGESVTKTVGNSATWSQTQSVAQQLATATNGSVNYMQAISSTMTNSFRNSQIVDERTSQSVDKAAFAQATAGASTPQISFLKASVEGGASWRVTTSDGKSYVVNQSAEEVRSMQTSVGETHTTTLSAVRSGQYGETAQKALAQLENIQGSRTAAESATVTYSRANEMREARGEAHSRAADVSANLSRDFYHYVGEKQFGGGAEGDREAIKHIEGLSAAGKTGELAKLKEEYLSDRNINIESLGEGLKNVKGPDLSKAPDLEAMRAKIEGGTAELKTELTSQPNIKATDPTAQVQGALKQTNVGAVDPAEVKAGLAADQKAIAGGKAGIESKGAEIKQDYTAGALPLAAKKTAAAAAVDAVSGLQQLVTGGYNNGAYVTTGAAPQPQVAPQPAQAQPEVQQQAPAQPQPVPAPAQAPVQAPVQDQKPEVQPAAQPQASPAQLAAEVTGAQSTVAPQQPADTLKPEAQDQKPEVQPAAQPQPQSQDTSQNLAAEVTAAAPVTQQQAQAQPVPAQTPAQNPEPAAPSQPQATAQIPKGALR